MQMPTNKLRPVSTSREVRAVGSVSRTLANDPLYPPFTSDNTDMLMSPNICAITDEVPDQLTGMFKLFVNKFVFI